MGRVTAREIPYNYTSADDQRICAVLFGGEVAAPLERLRFKRPGGQAWRLLMRFIGEIFIHRRNAFLYQELLEDNKRRNRFLGSAKNDLSRIAEQCELDPDMALLLDCCRRQLAAFRKELETARHLRDRVCRRLGGIVGGRNVFFDPFTLAAHATDATDWRMHMPLAVVCPEREAQVPLLLEAVAELGLKAVPRGGGTGLTGGAVPVAPGCIMINTEKMNRIGGVCTRDIRRPDGSSRPFDVIELEAGVITDDAMQAASAAGLIFSTDPTSAWACTVGGNIAENAGGKKAVLWGTCIDNLLGFRIAVPGGRLLEIQRINPSGGRIKPDETAVFSVTDAVMGNAIKQIRIPGDKLRKPGLGKDITNKTLEGLPGVQKEGTDGIITSATFILHRPYPEQRTVCLEFFGEDMEEASRVIDEITRAFVDRGKETLLALEHFDEEYVRAIQYKVKAPSNQSPKAVLLIDLVGHTAGQLESGLERLSALLKEYPNTGLTVARNEQEAERFWRDRKRLGAIAARTNAFKLNEDIVLPVKALAEFAEFVDILNVEEERENQQEVIWQLLAYLDTAVPIEDPEWLAAKLPAARDLLKAAMARINLAGRGHLKNETHLRHVKTSMAELLRGFVKVQDEIENDITVIRSRRIVVATHMHAGDGNVHVNIPVFSNDREMMLRAAETADTIMEKAVELGGAVSGEHGIGFTKIKHLDDRILADFQAYQQLADPGDLINPGKLTDRSVADRVFTPSFNLIELEARILRYSHLEQLAEKISRCVRCGRCKTDCCVFYPGRNLFYHPRNKNLALTGIIEALLYDAQRTQATGSRILRWLTQIADHCTLCHKCLAQCPVNIDTADVTILEREVLKARNARKTALPTGVVLKYLSSRSETTNRLVRRVVLQWGGAAQRLGSRLVGGQWRRFSFLAPFYAPAPSVADRALPTMFPRPRNFDHTLLLSPVGKTTGTVFYFPGCGSERMHADISLAVIYLLLETGLQVVLPPPYLCCGFPARANAWTDMNNCQELRNTIIFNQIRTLFGSLDFDGCVVSCGTCREGLERVNTAEIFGAPLMDAVAFVLDRGLDVKMTGTCVYHCPCHDSLDGKGEALLSRLTTKGAVSTPCCCSEAGTLALSRPDIAAAMLDRKRLNLEPFVNDPAKRPRLVTNCPACLSGLNRQCLAPAVHLATALADARAGLSWRRWISGQLARAERIPFY